MVSVLWAGTGYLVGKLAVVEGALIGLNGDVDMVDGAVVPWMMSTYDGVQRRISMSLRSLGVAIRNRNLAESCA